MLMAVLPLQRARRNVSRFRALRLMLVGCTACIWKRDRRTLRSCRARGDVPNFSLSTLLRQLLFYVSKRLVGVGAAQVSCKHGMRI